MVHPRDLQRLFDYSAPKAVYRALPNLTGKYEDAIVCGSSWRPRALSIACGAEWPTTTDRSDLCACEGQMPHDSCHQPWRPKATCLLYAGNMESEQTRLSTMIFGRSIRPASSSMQFAIRIGGWICNKFTLACTVCQRSGQVL